MLERNILISLNRGNKKEEQVEIAENLYKELKSLNDVINALKDDVHGCFWG